MLQANTIDTPGVMRRVLRLFRGYNKLTLTFNTFLPKGYSIELCDIKVIRAENAQMFRSTFVSVCVCLACGVSLSVPCVVLGRVSLEVGTARGAKVAWYIYIYIPRSIYYIYEVYSQCIFLFSFFANCRRSGRGWWVL